MKNTTTASIGIFLTLSVLFAHAEENPMIQRQKMAEQYMETFCFGNSWPLGMKVVPAENDTMQFSGKIRKIVNGREWKDVSRTYVISNRELHDIDIAVYSAYLSNDELATMLRFCDPSNIALKNALEKKSGIVRQRQLIEMAKSFDGATSSTIATFLPILAANAARQEREIPLDEKTALLEFQNSPQAKEALKKIIEQIIPEIIKIIHDIGKRTGTDTD